MNSKIFHITFIITNLLILLWSPNVSSTTQQYYSTCGTTFSCGSKIHGIGYPFRGVFDPAYCGNPNLVLTCDAVYGFATYIHISNKTYEVLHINQTAQTMRLVSLDVPMKCPENLSNTTFGATFFEYASSSSNLTFYYGCQMPDSLSIPNCGDGYYVVEGNNNNQRVPANCNGNVIVPIVANRHGIPPWRNAHHGFEIRWNLDNKACRDCVESNGRCGYNYDTDGTACFCRNPPYVAHNCSVVANAALSPADPPTSHTVNRSSLKRRRLQIGLEIGGATLAGVGLIFLIFYIRLKIKHGVASKSVQTLTKEIPPSHSSKDLLTTPSPPFTRSIPAYSSSNLHLGKDSSYFGIQVFDYAELEEATDHFNASRELGDGGFGTVYYGELLGGRVIAVKRLYDNNFKRVEQFMNEVEILTRLRHKNLVMLYGCTSKRSRELLLVYEYIPNGTVADHLHGKRAKSKGLLSWPVRLNIAVETAEALAYLHNSDIIHRDVKTNNILLGYDFHVKVADFGLSRLFPTNVTHISTAPQGTPGYVDPEYYQCYHLTEKSDVFSFGVVLIELLSSLQAVDTTRHRHDINLSNMAITKIQNRALTELVDPDLGFETDCEVRRMISSVAELAFRCLQNERDMRPSMDEVLEGLKRIQGENLNVQKVDIVDILVQDDDSEPLNDVVGPPSSDSNSTGTWLSGSAITSYGLSV